jgi:hypothetical protein
MIATAHPRIIAIDLEAFVENHAVAHEKICVDTLLCPCKPALFELELECKPNALAKQGVVGEGTGTFYFRWLDPVISLKDVKRGSRIPVGSHVERLTPSEPDCQAQHHQNPTGPPHGVSSK